MAQKLRNLFLRAENWFTGSYITDPGSKSMPSSPAMSVRNLSQHEVTCLKLKQLLDQGKYEECVELIRQKPHDYLTECLEKFPFLTMNKLVPASLCVWEVLLGRLHQREDRYIPQFPYSACDTLVLQIGRVMHKCETSPQPELQNQCRRVLKKVYMLYEDVLTKCFILHEQVSTAICSLSKHCYVSSDGPKEQKSLHETIKMEIEASIQDFQEAVQQLAEVMQNEVLSLPEILSQSDSESDSNALDVTSLPVTMLQIQERLYFNQTVLRTLQPRKRKGDLNTLTEMILLRINGDKDVLHLFAQMRIEDADITASEPVKPHLENRLHQLDLVISSLKDIEEELRITIKTIGPTILDPNEIHISHISDEDGVASKHASSGIFCEDEGSDFEPDVTSRPRSSSCGVKMEFGVKFKRKNSFNGSVHSAESVSSVKGGNLVAIRNDVANDAQGSFSSNRKSSSNPNLLQRVSSGNAVPMAGVRKPTFSPNLGHWSRSAGNIPQSSVGPGIRKFLRSGSPSSAGVPENGASAVSGLGQKTLQQLQQDLEHKRIELVQAQEVILQLRSRERELIDRLSEQAQKQLEVNGKFEDISLGTNRPSQIIQRYEELFTQGRMDALDFMEGQNLDTQFSENFLLEALQAAYRASQQELRCVHQRWRDALGIAEINSVEAPLINHLHASISHYLKRTSKNKDFSHLVKMVKNTLWEKHQLLPCIDVMKSCTQIRSFVAECITICWDMCIQFPPMVLNSSVQTFSPSLHRRVFVADRSSDSIIAYVWPSLTQGQHGPVLYQGYVIT